MNKVCIKKGEHGFFEEVETMGGGIVHFCSWQRLGRVLRGEEGPTLRENENLVGVQITDEGMEFYLEIEK